MSSMQWRHQASESDLTLTLMDAPIPPLTDAQAHRASLHIAENALDGDDARTLLAMLGLYEQETPT